MVEKKNNMHVNIGGIELKNPVMTASGTFGYARAVQREPAAENR